MVEFMNVRAIEYDSFWSWFLTIRNPFDKETGHFYWEPTYFSNELEFYTIASLTFLHAYRHGGRYLWLWFAILLHGFMVELVSYWLEPIDNFWHGQGTFMFFGQREPLQIILVYPSYLYICSIATIRLGVPENVQGCCIALLVILMDFPYDIMGIKLLWWTWHDTDANIRDRHYWVPWTSYYFHMTFACAFTLVYNFMRRKMVGITGTFSEDEKLRMPYAEQRKAENFRGELIAALTAGALGTPGGILQFVPGYHWGKDIFGIHAEFTTCMLAAIYLSISIYGVIHRRPKNIREEGEREVHRGDKRFSTGRWYYDEVYLAMLIHFTHYMILVLVTNPETYQVYGLHQPMGSPPGSNDGYDCDQVRNLTYPYPFTPGAWPDFLKSDFFPSCTIWKRPYLCPDEYLLDEGIFDYHCEKAQAQEWIPGNQKFWICGTDYTNKNTGTSRWEYIFYIYGTGLIAINIFTMFMYYPRTFYTQFFVYKEFPQYYKLDLPKRIVTDILDVRVGQQSGQQEYKVRTRKIPTFMEKLFNAANNPSHFQVSWVPKQELVLDGVGPVYGERGGQYGILFDTYQGSTRDRLRTFDSRRHALERIAQFKKTMISQQEQSLRDSDSAETAKAASSSTLTKRVTRSSAKGNTQ